MTPATFPTNETPSRSAKAAGGEFRSDDRNMKHQEMIHYGFGARKVEANALVVRPEAGRELCRKAILKYLSEDAPGDYRLKLSAQQDEVQAEVRRLLQEGGA